MPDLKEIFNALEEAFQALGIDFYLIGAQARDVWFSHAGKAPKQTNDVDFAVLVSNTADYERLREYLKEHKQFRSTSTNAFVMLTEEGAQVDILPFGGIQIDETVKIEGEGLTSIQVNGFMEVFESGTETADIATGHCFRVASLAAIVLLKLVAFDDRPEQRDKDPRDIADILDHYFELQENLIYEHHNDLFTDNATLLEIGGTVAGREIKKIIGVNPLLLQRISGILTGHINQRERSSFVRMMVFKDTDTVEARVQQLQQLLNGIKQQGA